MSRELDALVAEKVMGWKRESRPCGFVTFYAWDKGDGAAFPFPPDKWAPSTNPSDDYEVLKHVREKWDYDLCWQFSNALLSLYKTRRCNHPIAAYEPGDYSRAALKAMGLDVSAEVADGL